MKVKCKRCSRLILRKTAGKYQGFSRQCLKKMFDNSPKSYPIIEDSYSRISKELKCKEKSEVIPDKILPSIKEQIKTRLTAVLPLEKPSYEYHLGILSQVNYLKVKSTAEA